MFDWNDEEITNIIWGEAGESGDHIVPYPEETEEKCPALCGDQTRKEWNEDAANSETVQSKKPTTTTDALGVKPDLNSHCEKNGSLAEEGLRTESWPATSISDASKTEQGLTKPPEHDSPRLAGETAHLNNNAETIHNQKDKEEEDFVDYGWDNIGSFDDLVRIFSNDEPIVGHASLSSADELCSSSKGVTSSTEKSLPLSFDSPNLAVRALRSSSDQCAIKSECTLDQDPLSSDYGNMANVPPSTTQNIQACSAMGYAGRKTKILQKDMTAIESSGKTPSFNSQCSADILGKPDEFVDKANRQKPLLQTQWKSTEKSEVRQLQDICGSWSASGNQLRFDSRYAPSMCQPCPPFMMSHQRQLLGSESSEYKHFSGPILASPMYANNLATQYPPMSVFSQLPSGRRNHPKVISGCDASPANSDPLKRPPDHPNQPLPMTPQEKLEKLRRRQQMRAMLAIKKQHQQFNNQVLSAGQPNVEGASSEVEENLSTLPCSDPSLPLEQDESNTNSIAPNDFSLEDSIIYRLQGIIGKLDYRIRLCIRDSLFRLAQSASQRQYASDTSSTNRTGRHEVFNTEERNSQNRVARMPDVETETNTIDRTVAHLLFHRPLESSGKHAERPASPLSAKLPCERKAADVTSFPMMYLPQGLEIENTHPHDQSEVFFLLPEVDQSEHSPGLDPSENASNKETADGAVLGAEASQ